MNLSFNQVLVLAPHTDDAEFGCGGTIARLIEEGSKVHIATFSACESSVPNNFPSDILRKEFKNAAKTLGLNPENLYLYDYEVRVFNERRQDILQNLIELRTKIAPDLVLMPALEDVHQDHLTIAQEGIRAFKFTNILCYEMPWNNMSFHTNSFIHLTQEHIEKKVNAIKEYKSQKHRQYANEDFIRSLARTRGTQVNSYYAETFNVIRWIIKSKKLSN